MSINHQPPDWTKEQLDQLKEMWNNNLSLEEIALKLNRTPSACKNKLYAKGLTHASRRRLNLTGAAVEFVPWNNELPSIQEFIGMWRGGVSTEEMGKRYGRSPAAIKNRAQALNLGPRYAKYESSIPWDLGVVSSFRVCSCCETRRLIATSFSGDSKYCYDCITPTRSDNISFSSPKDPWSSDTAIGNIR